MKKEWMFFLAGAGLMVFVMILFQKYQYADREECVVREAAKLGNSSKAYSRAIRSYCQRYSEQYSVKFSPRSQSPEPKQTSPTATAKRSAGHSLMSGIARLREQYPEYSELSDEQLADGFYEKYYSDMSKADFYERVGLSNTLQTNNVKPSGTFRQEDLDKLDRETLLNEVKE